MAAAVIADLGVRAAFYVDSITFVVGALSVLPLRLRPLATPVSKASLSGRLEGRAAVGPFHAGRAAHVGPGGSGLRCRGAPSSSSSPLYVRDAPHPHTRPYSGCSRRRGGLGCW